MVRKLIRIGNSNGITLDKRMLRDTGLDGLTYLAIEIDKQGKRIIPKVERLFAGEDQKLCFYLEIYKNKPDPANLEVTYEIIDYIKRRLYQETEFLNLEHPSLSIVKSLNLDNLSTVLPI